MKMRVISIEEEVQGHNDAIAARNRSRFHAAGVTAINVMSAPGSGKTELLTRTLKELNDDLRCAVIVGDIATDNDARRLMSGGAETVQVMTNGYCHLDASMIQRAIDGMDLTRIDLLIIENVGNLVCPATFDLGEDIKIALTAVTEGEDKPLKYPTLFKAADAVVVSKIDLAGVVGYDRAGAWEILSGIAPQARIFELSARTGQGMEAWRDYLLGSLLGIDRSFDPVRS